MHKKVTQGNLGSNSGSGTKLTWSRTITTLKVTSSAVK